MRHYLKRNIPKNKKLELHLDEEEWNLLFDIQAKYKLKRSDLIRKLITEEHQEIK